MRNEKFSEMEKNTLLVLVLPPSFHVRVESASRCRARVCSFAGFDTIDSDPQKLCPDVFPRFRRDAARPESSRIACGVADFSTEILCEREAPRRVGISE